MSTSATDFNFSLEPLTYGPFQLGKDMYLLREASEDAYTSYRNISTKSLKLLDNGSTVSEGGQEADTILVQKSLFLILPGGAEVPAKLDFVRGLPRRITSHLYKKVREMSGMNEDEETVEFLTKRIERDTKKLKGLKEGKETEAKNE